MCVYVYTSFSLSFSTPNWISTATSRASGAWMCLVDSGTQDSSWNAATRSRVVVSSDKSVCQSVRLFSRSFLSSFPILTLPVSFSSFLSFLALSFFLFLSHFRYHNILYLLTDSFYRSQSFISFLTTDDVCTVVLLFTCRSFLLFRLNENKT